MEPIRLATKEEIDVIKDRADLTPNSSVLTLPGKQGGIFGVLRHVIELDPVFFNEEPLTRKHLFLWGVENMLRFTGAPEYYFNVPVSNEEYLKIIEAWGAQRTSKEPEYRFKKALI